MDNYYLKGLKTCKLRTEKCHFWEVTNNVDIHTMLVFLYSSLWYFLGSVIGFDVFFLEVENSCFLWILNFSLINGFLIYILIDKSFFTYIILKKLWLNRLQFVLFLLFFWRISHYDNAILVRIVEKLIIHFFRNVKLWFIFLTASYFCKKNGRDEWTRVNGRARDKNNIMALAF